MTNLDSRSVPGPWGTRRSTQVAAMAPLPGAPISLTRLEARIRMWRTGGHRAADSARKSETNRRLRLVDAFRSTAAWICSAIAILGLGCRPALPQGGPRIHVAPAEARGGEQPCAWFGDVGGGVLYFGVSSFWSALRASGGDPTADLRASGPRQIGRFDLAGERFLPPLQVGSGEAPGGVWDVLIHPNGHVYYTTYFDFAGRIDLASGATSEFADAGLGLNELALGPDGRVLVTRYGYGEDDEGSLVVLSEGGEVLAEHVLEAPNGLRVLAKSLAFDPLSRETWLNTDLLPPTGGAAQHDARVLDAAGRERLRFGEPELQFFLFGADGTGYFAEVDGSRLVLRERTASGAERVTPLDERFDRSHDFVQEIRHEADGSTLLTRWSGRVHVVERSGAVRDLMLPRTEAGELYYTGTRVGDRVCATRCGRVEVVCEDLAR